MGDLIDDIGLLSLASRRGRPTDKPELQLEYLRDLTAEDIRMTNECPAAEAYNPLQSLRATHHALARAVAQGLNDAECSALTGHTPATVYRLRTLDPAFRDLVSHYTDKVNEQFIDVQARLALLGIATVEELTERLEVEPGKFSNNELFRMAEMALDRSVAPSKGQGPGRGGAGAPASGVNINVTFVSPKGGGEQPNAVIDVNSQPALEGPK